MQPVPTLSKYEHINTSIYGLIHPKASVLDVGCWTGSLGSALIKNKSCQVDGIEKVSAAIDEARKQGYQELYQKDLNDIDNLDIKFKQYDCIVFADVLEHILYPEKVLSYYKDFLKEGGYIVVSLPNIAFLLYRLKLLFGTFDYKEVGVMDKTHVKLYTLKTMKELFEYSGFDVVKMIKYNEVSPRLFLLQFLKEVLPTLFTLQFTFLLKKKS